MRYKICSAYVLVFVLFLCLDGAAHANVCYTCHEKASFTDSVVHDPVAKDACNACHNPHVARYQGLLVKQDSNLCYQCHRSEKFQQGKMHKPIKQGQCLVCHAPHSSRSAGLLRSDDIVENCYSCHQKPEYKNVHEVYAKGDCLFCHQSHQSSFKHLLKNEPDPLCMSCHKQQDIVIKHPNFPEEIKNCISCHHPHGSDNKALIRNVLHEPFKTSCQDCHGKEKLDMDVCLQCHAEINDHLNTTHSHLTETDRNSCMICHTPHAGDSKNLLRGKIDSICRNCHESSFIRYEESIYKHEKFLECGNCHDVHGSNHWAMLNGDGNETCVGCHETQGQFSHPVGETVKDPRTKQNLTCVTCHYPHGTHFRFELKMSGARDLCIQCHRSY